MNHHTVTYEIHDEYRADILLKFEERQLEEINVELQLPLVENISEFELVLNFV